MKGRAKIGPPCLRCGLPVSRRWDAVPQKMGWRIVNGKAWCWYCSKACGCAAIGEANTGDRTHIARWNRTQAEKRALLHLLEMCKGLVTAEGLVPVRSLVRAWMKERAAVYSRGYTARRHREGYQRRSA